MTRDARVLVRFLGGVHDGWSQTMPKRIARPGSRLSMPSTAMEDRLRASTESRVMEDRSRGFTEEQKPLVFLPPIAEEQERLVAVPRPLVYVLEDRDGEIVAVYQPPG
jgi:hypothetical protein